MADLMKRIEAKLERYTRQGNQKCIRMYQRERWALEGMMGGGFEFQTIVLVYQKFARLDLVPTHYNYPEFYQF